jgi:hypothetical protein
LNRDVASGRAPAAVVAAWLAERGMTDAVE